MVGVPELPHTTSRGRAETALLKYREMGAGLRGSSVEAERTTYGVQRTEGETDAQGLRASAGRALLMGRRRAPRGHRTKDFT